MLTVRSEWPFPYEPDSGDKTNWRRTRRPFGRLERSLRVPPGLDPNGNAATLSDGVLTQAEMRLAAKVDDVIARDHA